MDLRVFDLGLVDYRKALDFQKGLFRRVQTESFKSAMILCRHYPVITLGRRANEDNILVSECELEKKGIQMYRLQRGGDVTYHGPGQLVIYPIFNLSFFKKDIHLFLRRLEEVAIGLLSDFGIKASRLPGLTGVWIEKQKIASIGIAIRNWITFHGLSINIKKNDLLNFRLIRPCGIDSEMTSLERVLNRNIEMGDIKEKIIHRFRENFPDIFRRGG